jgi:hypothetical protein
MSLAVIVATAAARVWTRVYTSGMPSIAMERRRAEIESDLWELCHDSDGEQRLSAASQIVWRLVAGIADDLTWRLEHTTFQDNVLVRRVVTLAAAMMVLSMLWGSSDTTSRLAGCPNAPRKARVDQVVACVGTFFEGVPR